jgi:segregation and condensation protein B
VYESDVIEETEFIEDSQLESIIESILFASDRPVSLARIKEIFVGTQVSVNKIKSVIEKLAIELASPHRGVTLEEVAGGYQLRTKIENQKFLHRSQKNRPFRLSAPALEVLSIVAYKQPVVKSEIDQIRGVESGHLLRALMEKGLVCFGEKSDLPGRPMYYQTTRKFLEVFGLRNLKELPTLSQIDELLPEGIDEIEADRKQGLEQITDTFSQGLSHSYSEGEEELQSITQDLQEISTSTEFFEQEKKREQEARDAERAQSLREALLVGETLSSRDANWLKRYEERLLSTSNQEAVPVEGAVQARSVTEPPSDDSWTADLAALDKLEESLEDIEMFSDQEREPKIEV